MKELTKKILEAGIIDKTMAAMLERWGMLSPEELSLVTPEQRIKESLSAFLEEIELLTQPEAIERHETQLDPLLAAVYDPTKGH